MQYVNNSVDILCIVSRYHHGIPSRTVAFLKLINIYFIVKNHCFGLKINICYSLTDLSHLLVRDLYRSATHHSVPN